MPRKVLSPTNILIALLLLSNGFWLWNAGAFRHSAAGATPGLSDTLSLASDTIGQAPRDTTSYERLKYFLEALSKSDSLSHGVWGFCLATADSGQIIAQHNPDQSLVPASVMKAITTGAALAKMGSGYRFCTRLQYDGSIDKANRILNGNLYIKGSGDPSLGSSVFTGNHMEAVLSRWAEAVKELGIDSINGAVIGDGDVFEDDLIPAGWAWEDIQSDYGAGPCGLSFRENMYDINVRVSGKGLSYAIDPAVPGLKLYNRLAVDESVGKSFIYVTGAPYMNERVMIGAIAPFDTEFQDQSMIPDPPFFSAWHLLRYLKEYGIGVKDSCTSTMKIRFGGNKYERKERTTFNSICSPSLAQIVYHTNHVSQNFYAESVLKGLSLNEVGYGSSAGGAGVVRSWLKSIGVDLRGLCMVDGSGVSRFNLVTTRQLVTMLNALSKDSSCFEAFYNSLPVAGESGTMSKICKGTCAEQNVMAKSGSMSRVKSYAGYVKDRKGRLLSFAMIANNFEYAPGVMRDKFEQLMVLMAELDTGPYLP